jgi:hypothetical protein
MKPTNWVDFLRWKATFDRWVEDIWAGSMRTLKCAALVAVSCLLAVAANGPVLAGVTKFTPDMKEEQERREEAELRKQEAERAERAEWVRQAVDRYYRAALDQFPGLTAPLIDYVDETMPPVCRGQVSRTHAILVGADDIGVESLRLEGPANDLALLSDALASLGVASERIHLLKGPDATRSGLAQAFKSVLPRLGCEDQVILHFSAYSITTSEALSAIKLPTVEAGADAEPSILPKDIPARLAEDAVELDPQQRVFADNVFARNRADVVVLLNDDSETFNEVILGRDISDYMVAVRNKGAHAIAVMDINHAAAADIQGRHREAGDASIWSHDFADPGQHQKTKRSGPSLIPGHGDFAAFYASGAEGMTPEMKIPRGDPDAKHFGLFTYSVAEALLWQDNMTPRSIADRIGQSQHYGERYKHMLPVIEASQPDMVVVAESARSRSGGSPIRILNPTPKRGAMTVQKAQVEIEGIVDWPAPVLGVHVDQMPAEREADGRFKSTVKLASGLNRVSVMAVTADSKLHSSTLEFVYDGDRKALEGDGRRIAIVIANQDYSPDTGMRSLSTPFADADALADVLARKYGFTTSLTSEAGENVSLFLRNPTKRDIELAMHRVGKAVGAKDTVLIFYAGHGVFEPVTSTAYWVPSDAEHGFEPSYLSAADISAAIQRMQAGNVILISDSCYSGALLRGGEPDSGKINEEARMQALLTLQARRSRIVISSGNNEPVEDLGGAGHSVFARALLTGLETMEYEAFSARELFDGYILQQVTANADQEPQYRPLEKVGHEGGDFVFVKSPAS